jgi:hypothetical protein
MAVPNQRYWRAAIVGCALAAAIYVTYLRPARSPQLPESAGWDDLAPCSDALSLDRTKQLSLESDGRAVLHDIRPVKPGETPQDRTANGAWRLDASSKRYSITFKDETTNYQLLASSDISTCVLVKGELDTANLLKSWFAIIDDDAADYGPDYSERHEPR